MNKGYKNWENLNRVEHLSGGESLLIWQIELIPEWL